MIKLKHITIIPMVVASLYFSTGVKAEVQTIILDSQFEVDDFCLDNNCLQVIDISTDGSRFQVIYDNAATPPGEEPPADDTPPADEPPPEIPPVKTVVSTDVAFFDSAQKASNSCIIRSCLSTKMYYPYITGTFNFIPVYVVTYATKARIIENSFEHKTTSSLTEVVDWCYELEIRCTSVKYIISDYTISYYRSGNAWTNPTPKPPKPGEETEE
jgi:hypothetical protein